MAGAMVEVAKATITLVPNMAGSQGEITKQLTDITKDASEQAGDEGGSAFGSKFANAIKGSAAVVGAAIAGVTAAAVGTGKAFVDAAKDVASYGDTVDKQSQRLGLSAKSYQELDYVLNLAGSSMDSMSAGVKTLTNQLDAAKNGSEAAQGMFAALGLSMDDLANMSREDVFKSVIFSFSEMEDTAERAALANDLLGRSGQQLAPLFNMTSEEIAGAIEQANEYGMVMSDEAVSASADFTDSMTTLNKTLAGVKNSLMGEFLPGLTEVTSGLAAVFAGGEGGAQIEAGIQELAANIVAKAPELFAIGGTIITALITSIVNNLPTLISSVLPVLGDTFTHLVELAPDAINAVMDLLNGVLNWLVNGGGLVTLINGVVSLITSLANSISKNIGTLIPMVVQGILTVITTLTSPEVMIPMLQAGLTLLTELINGILSALPLIIEQLPVIIQNIVDTLILGLPLILDAGIQIFMAIIQAIPVILQSLITELPTIINTIIDFVINSIPLLLESAITLLMAIIQAIPTIIVSLVQELPNIITTIISTLLERLPDLIMGAIELFMGIITAIPTIIVELGKQMPTIISAIVEGLISGVGQIASVGGDLIRGLWQGISDMTSWIGEKLKSFGDGIVNGLKSFFGIASPSKLFKNVIGKNLALGIGAGFEDEIGNVENDIVKSMDGLTGDMTASVSAYGTAGAAIFGGGGETINSGGNVINVYAAEGQDINALADEIAIRLENMTARKRSIYA